MQTKPLLTINLSALARNYKMLDKYSSSSLCGAVIKANAYGLGVEEVIDCLYSNGCRNYFVANIYEAIEIRNKYKNIDIFILDGLASSDIKLILEKNLIPVLNSLDEIYSWVDKSSDTEHPIAIHFDTGMARLGLAESDVLRLYKNKNLIDKLAISFIFTHLSCSSEPDNLINDEQIILFNKLTKLFPGIRTSVGNSGTILKRPDLLGDLVRPGIALYGMSPFQNLENPMEKVFSLTAPILQLREANKKITVGYGANSEVSANSLLATIGVGYADGIPRSLSNREFCFINDKKVKIVGPVSMDLITIDVSSIPKKDLYIGCGIEIFGNNSDIDSIASSIDTIGYELLTRLGSRIERKYIYDN